MRAILGIGNHGKQYEATRHNCGFFVVDALAQKYGLSWSANKRWKTETCTWRRSGDDQVILLRPQTYVNGSGETAQAACAYYKIKPADLLIIVDDIHLKFGDIRLRTSGSSGGHNGLKDIERRLGRDYPRVRMGISAPSGDQVGHVLGKFSPDEQADLQLFVDKAVLCCEDWLSGGSDLAMRHNGPLRPPPPKPKKLQPAKESPEPSNTSSGDTKAEAAEETS